MTVPLAKRYLGVQLCMQLKLIEFRRLALRFCRCNDRIGIGRTSRIDLQQMVLKEKEFADIADDRDNVRKFALKKLSIF